MTMLSKPEDYQYALIKPSDASPNLIEPAAINANGQVVGFTGVPFGYLRSDVGFEYVNGNLTIIQTPDARSSEPTAINASGTIVGDYVPSSASPNNLNTDGFIDNNGMFTSLSPPGAISTQVKGINDSGVVLGDYAPASGGRASFTYDHGLYSAIAVPGAGVTFATGINNSGIVVGTYEFNAGSLQLSGNFIYDHGTYTTIANPGNTGIGGIFGFSAINNNGEIVGNTLMAGHRTGFIYDNGAFTFLAAPDATLTSVNGINDRGEVVGNLINASGSHAFVYENGSFTQLDVPGAFFTEGLAINDRGQVTGAYGDAPPSLAIPTPSFGFIATPTDDGKSWSFLKNAGCDLSDFQSGTVSPGSEARGNHAEHHDNPRQAYGRGYNAAPDNDRAGSFPAPQDWRHM